MMLFHYAFGYSLFLMMFAYSCHAHSSVQKNNSQSPVDDYQMHICAFHIAKGQPNIVSSD